MIKITLVNKKGGELITSFFVALSRSLKLNVLDLTLMY